MKIIDFIDILKINEKSEAEKATLLCFYHSKENDEWEFTLSRIASIMIDSGYNAPNTSRLKEQLVKGKGRNQEDKYQIKDKAKIWENPVNIGGSEEAVFTPFIHLLVSKICQNMPLFADFSKLARW